ncbi:hypothetical protein PVAP13_2KG411521 [Panicum virgatum]|uniref:Uncharacterized protein n=1 Tax=Panicum virgatum TaxID=38727 RepID=A0A8T0WA64_PANVG|nr:hypothetical protein PVAP13_2KG411521 [Panicum virgatum]
MDRPAGPPDRRGVLLFLYGWAGQCWDGRVRALFVLRNSWMDHGRKKLVLSYLRVSTHPRKAISVWCGRSPSVRGQGQSCFSFFFACEIAQAYR